MPKYKLYYFNGRGRAEVTRLVFAQAGMDYEDIRLDQDEWLDFKPKTPFGHMPVLEVDGALLADSKAIPRFIATEAGLCGKDATEAALTDSIMYRVLEVIEMVIKKYMSPTQAEKDAGAKELEEKLPTALEKLTKFLCNNRRGTGFFIGENVTLADICFFAYFDTLVNLQPNVLDGHPKLKALFHRVGELPRIKDWIEKRPQTSF